MVQKSKTNSHVCIWSLLHWSDKVAGYAKMKARTHEQTKKGKPQRVL